MRDQDLQDQQMGLAITHEISRRLNFWLIDITRHLLDDVIAVVGG
ncbi:hypothetical protein [Streptosporangium sp. LJ11]